MKFDLFILRFVIICGIDEFVRGVSIVYGFFFHLLCVLDRFNVNGEFQNARCPMGDRIFSFHWTCFHKLTLKPPITHQLILRDSDSTDAAHSADSTIDERFKNQCNDNHFDIIILTPHNIIPTKKRKYSKETIQNTLLGAINGKIQNFSLRMKGDRNNTINANPSKHTQIELLKNVHSLHLTRMG